MSIESNRSSKTSTRRKKAPAKRSMLEIRKPQPGEAFFATGNMACRQCLITAEHIDIGYNIGHRHYPVADTVSNALAAWIQLVLFYQAVSDSGEEFVYPQVLLNGRNEEDWEACGSEGFLLPAWHWLQIEVCSDCDEVSWDIGLPVSDACYSRLEFTKRLSKALAPSVIDTLDHPLILRLESLFCNAQVNSANSQGEVN